MSRTKEELKAALTEATVKLQNAGIIPTNNMMDKIKNRQKQCQEEITALIEICEKETGACFSYTGPGKYAKYCTIDRNKEKMDLYAYKYGMNVHKDDTFSGICSCGNTVVLNHKS